jgi:hypothetical protein
MCRPGGQLRGGGQTLHPIPKPKSLHATLTPALPLHACMQTCLTWWTTSRRRPSKRPACRAPPTPWGVAGNPPGPPRPPPGTLEGVGVGGAAHLRPQAGAPAAGAHASRGGRAACLQPRPPLAGWLAGACGQAGLVGRRGGGAAALERLALGPAWGPPHGLVARRELGRAPAGPGAAAPRAQLGGWAVVRPGVGGSRAFRSARGPLGARRPGGGWAGGPARPPFPCPAGAPTGDALCGVRRTGVAAWEAPKPPRWVEARTRGGAGGD